MYASVWNFKRVYPTRYYICWTYIDGIKYQAASICDDFGNLVITEYL